MLTGIYWILWHCAVLPQIYTTTAANRAPLLFGVWFAFCITTPSQLRSMMCSSLRRIMCEEARTPRRHRDGSLYMHTMDELLFGWVLLKCSLNVNCVSYFNSFVDKTNTDDGDGLFSNGSARCARYIITTEISWYMWTLNAVDIRSLFESRGTNGAQRNGIYSIWILHFKDILYIYQHFNS